MCNWSTRAQLTAVPAMQRKTVRSKPLRWCGLQVRQAIGSSVRPSAPCHRQSPRCGTAAPVGKLIRCRGRGAQTRLKSDLVAASNKHCGVYIYLDEVGMLKGLPPNRRASGIAKSFGFDDAQFFVGLIK